MEAYGGYPAISDYAFLSDGHSSALIAKNGSVEWACFHRYDAAPVFAGILDRKKGGHFSIRPVGEHEVSRRYLPDTNVLETRFEAEAGVVTLTDFLPVHEVEGRPGSPGRRAPGHAFVRRLAGQTGTVEMEVEFFPTFDYARAASNIRVEEGRVTATSGTERLTLDHESLPMDESGGGRSVGRLTISEGDETHLVLTSTLTRETPPTPMDAEQPVRLLEETVTFWRNWASRCTYRGPYREAVVRSLLTLKGLIYDKTGALVAAPSTSLPEEIGGTRNWDYRFTWIRDSSAILAALAATGYLEEAKNFADWLFSATEGNVKNLQILYGIGGERDLVEEQLDHLEGYQGSRPVHIGNAAYGQFQLDIYGELIAAAYFASILPGYQLDKSRAPFVRDVIDLVIQRWQDPDDGIWEARTNRRHYVFSKAMAWLAIECGIRMLDNYPDVPRKPELRLRWVQARDEIRKVIEEKGIDPERGCFVQSFGAAELDAATLQLVLRRFLPADDPRISATVDEIDGRLTKNGHVYRYLTQDGLTGGEGAFTFCTLWLASSLARTGRIDEAEQRLGLVLACANDVGLLAEEVDPATGHQLGNFPQGFSHLGVVAAALEIEAARAGGW
ncbi:glycoside hydrolase family 15 protein [Streptomyces sp. NPDC047028]|uniref:glycoside hydrolase family 15 protein n=1 Tax=Streptomyces sp. NPDC047028 TaxID=3155793 RepID=UPI0033FD7244